MRHIVCDAFAEMGLQVNPERDKISNFGQNEFIIQNLNFYKQQYEQVFRFWDPHPTNQILRNNIDEGDVLSQQYLQKVISESSDPVVEPLQTTPGGKAIKQERIYNCCARL